MARRTATAWVVQCALVAVALAGLAGASQLGWGTGASPGPGMFPGIASATLLVFNLLAMVRPGASPADEEGGHPRRLLAYAAALLVAAFGLGILGFPLATALAVLIMLVPGEGLPARRALVVAVLAVAGTVAVFHGLLGVPLPLLPVAWPGAA